MDVLVLAMEGDREDLDFLRLRAVGALEDLVDEYERNLDGPVEVSWDWEETGGAS